MGIIGRFGVDPIDPYSRHDASGIQKCWDCHPSLQNLRQVRALRLLLRTGVLVSIKRWDLKL